MFWQKRRTAVELNTLPGPTKCLATGEKDKKLLLLSFLFFLLSEISKPKRRGINYSPSLRCLADRLTVTGDGYRVSVRLQSRHDRGSGCNMFAA